MTTRTGIAGVTFPRSPANLVFKVGGSINPVAADEVDIGERRGRGTGDQRTVLRDGDELHAPLRRAVRGPFTSGTFGVAGTEPGAATCSGTTCGAYVSFDTTPATRTVLMKVGISFVSTADAAQNLHAEDPGWSLTHVVDQATPPGTRSWRMAVGGGMPAEEHTFYTALYHSLLFPNVVSDVTGTTPAATARSTPTTHGGVRQLLGVGHLPGRDPADRPSVLTPSATWSSPSSTTPSRRVAAQVGHRRRRRVADERRLGRPDHRRRLRHGRANFDSRRH